MSDAELRRTLNAYKIALGVCAEEVMALRAEVLELRDDAEKHRRLRTYQRQWARRRRSDTTASA